MSDHNCFGQRFRAEFVMVKALLKVVHSNGKLVRGLNNVSELLMIVRLNWKLVVIDYGELEWTTNNLWLFMELKSEVSYEYGIQLVVVSWETVMNSLLLKSCSEFF